MKPDIRIGTSGWNYREWRGDFYPVDVPMRKWLGFYAKQFNSVEINYTFYRLPSAKTCSEWNQSTPKDFQFAFKASRYLTHVKRLVDVRDSWNQFLSRIAIPGRKLGPILLQFPATFTATDLNLNSIAQFLKYATIGRGAPELVMEFRDSSCFGAPMIDILRKYGCALAISHSRRYPVPNLVDTADFVYFRFHGPQTMFASSYSKVELSEWSRKLADLTRNHRSIYAYFNNDSGGHAPRNAAELRRQVYSRLMQAGQTIEPDNFDRKL